jgi:uncharacterized protein (TIGR03790 family)
VNNRFWLAVPAIWISACVRLLAGGSGLNVAVVVNQESPDSVELGMYYCERRNVPPQNLLRIGWTGSKVEWSLVDFNSRLRDPLIEMLATRGLTNQVDFVVLSLDIPYRVRNGESANSTTSTLFYGFKLDDEEDKSCSLPEASTNHYAGTEGIFRATVPGTTANSFLVTMLTSSNLPQAKAIVDQGVAGDGVFPQQPVFLGKSQDRLRNVRYFRFDNAVFNARVLARSTLTRTNVNTPAVLGHIAGYQNGVAGFSMGTSTFAPGSMADDLTSHAGRLYEPNDQTTLLAFLQAGACGSYGTIIEPCAHLGKFPSPQNYFYQARGFTVAECYYQSLEHPHQGLLVAEPLSAPYACPGTGQFVGLSGNPVLSGKTNFALRFTAADPTRPLQQIDLFVDGTFFQTLTNLNPQAGNKLHVNLNGQNLAYTIKSGATLKSVTEALASMIDSRSNTTAVGAVAHSDRIELQSLEVGVPGSHVALSVSNSTTGTAALTTHLRASGPALLDTDAYGYRSYYITNPPALGDYLQLIVIKTNGQTVVNAVTNAEPGTKLGELTKALLSRASSDPALQGPDGLAFEDINMHEDFPFNVYIYGTNDHSGEFNIRAKGQGWPAAQMRVCLRGSPGLKILPAGTNRLDEAISDLRPRAHLYLTAGLFDLATQFELDTRTLPDGAHRLTAIAHEGSHVRTQTRADLDILVANNPWFAALSFEAGSPTTLVGSPLRLKVAASADDIARIELHSTGGALATNLGASTAAFEVDTLFLGPGLHSFHALVFHNGGDQFRTAPLSVRLV